MHRIAFAALIAVALIARADNLEMRVRTAVSGEAPNVESLRAIGPRVLPLLVQLYKSSDEAHRTTIAAAFYQLGWKSEEAKAALMQDVHTPNESLRLQVQWALGRVSADPAVIETLAGIMVHDASPLFRDKAACALANDQIHLSEHQKVLLFAKVIQALRDPKPQVRQIAIEVMRIQTGQTKGYAPNAPVMEREKSVREWETWLTDYQANW